MGKTSRSGFGQFVPLGRITGVHGLKGWVKVHSDTVPRDGIVQFTHWTLSGKPVAGGSNTVRVLEGREQGKTVVARLEGIEDRDSAAALTGSEIAVPREDLPPLDGGGFYWTDLIGMTCVTVAGERVGSVDRLFETGANDVLVVADERDGAKRGAEVLVPWIRLEVIIDVDLDARCITFDWDPDF